jgi:acyl carrier protein
MSNEEKIKLLIEGLKEIADKEIGPEGLPGSTLLSELKLDSLDIVELLMFYEEKTGQVVPDPSKEMKTVDDLLMLLP